MNRLVRIEHGRGRHRRPRHRRRRNGPRHCRGVESMSRAPYVMNKADAAWRERISLEDTTLGWRFVNPKMEQPVRRALDGGDRRERRRGVQGLARGPGCLCASKSAARRLGASRRRLGEEIVPVTIPQRKAPVTVSATSIRGGHDLEALEQAEPTPWRCRRHGDRRQRVRDQRRRAPC